VRIAELGERALVRLLDALSHGESGGDERHAPELVLRATTRPDARG
jgi:DNA-binding LacI/PurR family transcriptional regulator